MTVSNNRNTATYSTELAGFSSPKNCIEKASCVIDRLNNPPMKASAQKATEPIKATA